MFLRKNVNFREFFVEFWVYFDVLFFSSFQKA